MKKLRLLCIPPYEGMYNLMTNLAAQRSDVEFIIHMGNLEDGLKAVLENRHNNIDAVISRGGTAETIRAHCGDIPACDIIPSVYDVLRTIRLAQGMAERFAVVGFPSITKPADMLRDIMQYDFQVRTIRSGAECEACIRRLRDEGVQAVVGDTISAACARKLGMHGLLIVSGIESVESAINSAVKMHHYYDSISKRAALFSDLLAAEDRELLIYTAKGHPFFSNVTDLPEDISRLLAQKVSNVIAQDSLKIMRRAENCVLSINGQLLQSGGEDYCVYTITRLSNTAVFDRYLIQYLPPETDLPDSKPMEYYLGVSEEITAVRAACDRYALMSAPVLLTGARGTGKDRFAHYIYAHSKRKHSSFVSIDAGLLDDKGWNFLLKNDRSPLTDSGLTIFFQRMQSAAPAQQQQFIIYLKNSRVFQANRLIFSYTEEEGAIPQDDLYLYLTETVGCLCLHTPSLAQRREDIPTLVSLYINAVNVEHSTRVVGLTHDAMLTLQNHTWTRNVDQLFQFVQELVIGAKTSYISGEQVQSLLAREMRTAPALTETGINLDRTLDEIVQDIVLRVYEAENLNQTRTAKHLGISRSTLWRMLK